MTTAENERLAVVETEVKSLTKAVTGLDGKVDTIVLWIAGEKAARAERRRDDEARTAEREKAEGRRRWLLSVGIPALISIMGLVVGKVL